MGRKRTPEQIERDRLASNARYQRNRESILARNRRRYSAKRDEILAASAKRYANESAERRAERRALNAKWRAANPHDPAKQAEYDAGRYAHERDKILAWGKRWKDANKDRVSANCARWRKENPDKWRASIANWRAANSELVAAYNEQHSVKRRAILAEAGTHSRKEWRELLDTTGHVCVCCGIAEAQSIFRFRKSGEPVIGRLTKDHILPLTMGGKHTIDNIQPLCLPCNQRKQNKHIDYLNGNCARPRTG